MHKDQMLAKQYFLGNMKERKPTKTLPMEGLDLWDEVKEGWGKPIVQLTMVWLGDKPNQIVQIGVLLPPNLWDKLVAFLQDNSDYSPGQPSIC